MSVSATQPVSSTGSIESLIPTLPSENAATAISPSKLHMFGADDDSPSFWDLLDVVNPLQHIPIINHLYREATDDKIGVGARLAGGALFGGPLGLVGAAFNCVLEEATGDDTGGHILALFRDDPATDTGTRLADATPKTEPQPQALAENANSPGPTDLGDLIGTGPAPNPASDSSSSAAASPPPASAPPPAAAPQASVASAPLTPDTSRASAAAAAAAGTAEMASRSTRMGRNGHDMPAPARTIALATQSPPALGMAVSTTSTRSNIPVTGRRPTQTMIAATSGRTMVEAQEGGPSGAGAAPAVPLTPAPSSTGGNAANPPDWFVAAMSQGLDKYDRTTRRAATQTDASP